MHLWTAVGLATKSLSSLKKFLLRSFHFFDLYLVATSAPSKKVICADSAAVLMPCVWKTRKQQRGFLPAHHTSEVPDIPLELWPMDTVQEDLPSTLYGLGCSSHMDCVLPESEDVADADELPQALPTMNVLLGTEGSRDQRLLHDASPSAEISPLAQGLLGEVPLDQFVLPPGGNFAELKHLRGHLDLFSGCKRHAFELARITGRWVLTYDWDHSPTEDLLLPQTRSHIEAMISAGCFDSLTAGPECCSFSRAVRPPVRSLAHPRGLQRLTFNMKKKVRAGNRHSQWLARIVAKALDRGMAVWVENPHQSYLWAQPEWVSLSQKSQMSWYTVDYCTFGCAWRKRTKFLTSTSLKNTKHLCQCGRNHKHQPLVGYSKTHKQMWTKVAEPYPHDLCVRLAQAVAQAM